MMQKWLYDRIESDCPFPDDNGQYYLVDDVAKLEAENAVLKLILKEVLHRMKLTYLIMGNDIEEINRAIAAAPEQEKP